MWLRKSVGDACFASYEKWSKKQGLKNPKIFGSFFSIVTQGIREQF